MSFLKKHLYFETVLFFKCFQLALFFYLLYNVLYILTEVFTMNTNWIPFFFICMKMYSFIHYRSLAYFIHNFSILLHNRRKDPKIKQIVFVDKDGLLFAFFFIIDIFFLLYCIYLMMDDATWKAGILLLTTAFLEAYGVRARIYGTYVIDPLGFAYSSVWFRYLMTGMSLYILLKLLHA